jgi:hypothetical protein
METLNKLQNKKNRDYRERNIAGTVKEIESFQYSCDGLKE